MLLSVLTFAPFAVFAFLMLDRFSVNRFAVGYQPMFAILLSDGFRRAGGWIAARQGRWRPETAAAALVAAMIGGFAIFALPALTAVRREVAPPVLAVQAVRERVDPARERLYVAHSVSKFVDLYAPNVPYTRVIDDRVLPLTDPARAWILGETTGMPLGGLVFRRERGNLWNIARHQNFEIRLAPLERRARFVSGWGEPVVEGIHEWRAMGAHSVTLLPPARGTTKLRLHFYLPEELVAERARLLPLERSPAGLVPPRDPDRGEELRRRAGARRCPQPPGAVRRPDGHGRPWPPPRPAAPLSGVGADVGGEGAGRGHSQIAPW